MTSNAGTAYAYYTLGPDGSLVNAEISREFQVQHATLERQGAPAVTCEERRAESLREDARARGVTFRALGNVHQATLAMVAPGIAEALVATAMGLFAAIPAVVAYNRYSNDVERLINRYDNFLEEFSSILMRQVH